MNKALRPVFTVVFLLGTAFAAQAQANLVHGIVAGMMLGHHAINGDFNDKTVTAITYRGQKYSMKRITTEPGSATVAADPAAQLESQLELCRIALFADSTGTVCPANRRAVIEAIHGIVAQSRPGLNMKPYRTELAFYLAEDARRQKVAGSAVPK